MKYTHHMGINVRGMLKWPASKRRIFTDANGKKISAEEATDHLLNMLSEGHEILPISEECDNWDKKIGCKGHNEDGSPRIEEVSA